MAFIAYAIDNNNSFPAPAGVDEAYPEDWVHWQPGQRPAARPAACGTSTTTPECWSARRA